MLKYLKKFILDILPSVAATIIGAYVVNHYVIPAAAPKDPAAAVATAAAKSDAKADSKPETTAGDSFAKGVAEKAAIEKTAEKAAEKSADSAPADSRKKHVVSRTANRTPESAPAADSADERRDANDLARAAIERLRPPAAEPARTVAVAQPTPILQPPAVTPVMAPLPPATMVAPPSPEVFSAGTGAVMTTERLPQQASAAPRAGARPTPPADIPAAPPLDLHTDVSQRTTVAEDVMSAAKSVFHAVLPR